MDNSPGEGHHHAESYVLHYVYLLTLYRKAGTWLML